MSEHPALAATYRLQLHEEFTLADATRIVPYLQRLGISHVYSSPILRARPGSTHGYDVADPTTPNPELGGERERRRLIERLQNNDMGLLLDIVPNHMGSGRDNPFWEDVLTHGTASRYARWFDIRWQSPERPLRGRVLLPVLGDKLTKVLARGELSVVVEKGRLRIRYFDDSFPLDPGTLPAVLALALRQPRRKRTASPSPAVLERLRDISERLARLPRATGRAGKTDTETPAPAARADEAEKALSEFAALYRRSAAIRERLDAAVAAFGKGAAGRDRMRALVAAQPYRLAYWKRAARLINYRRFFDINELVALRMEDPQVFAETHALVLKWVTTGEVLGLRIDHVDGLLDPLGYLQRLRTEILARRGEETPAFPILVEKILSQGERLRAEWPVQGTTGYEFLNDLESIFIDPVGFEAIEAWYRAVLPRAGRQRARDFEDIAHDGKVNILTTSLSADIARLARLLQPIARRDGRVSSLSRAQLARALVEWIACFPVYRTYVDGRTPEPHPADRAVIERAAARCRKRGTLSQQLVDFLRDSMLELGEGPERAIRLGFIARLQQTSGPATAKGVEDTALYVHVPLVSLNEVGGEPDRPLEQAVQTFHSGNTERATDWPRSLLCTNTHDTKRSADVRARLDVLSEIPEAWMSSVRRWRDMNRSLRSTTGGRAAPDANTEYLLYQTLVGVWPLGPKGAPVVPDAEEMKSLRTRVHQYMEKAVREAKTHTSWTERNEEYEKALGAFLERLLPARRAASSPFVQEMAAFAARVSRPGLWNALGRIAAHFTTPGTPDLYQGDELWNFSLVDPDNRRPVDFKRRRTLLAALERCATEGSQALQRLAAELVTRPEDDRLKLLVTWRSVQARRASSDLFTDGSYEPLVGTAAAERHLVAFARHARGGCAVTVVSRLTTSLVSGGAPVGRTVWGNARIRLPQGTEHRHWTCLLDGHVVASERDSNQTYVLAGEVLRNLPVALLVPHGAGT